MLLSPSHPKYDPAMELLCLLPPAPYSVNLEDLRVDLGLKSQSKVLDLCDVVLERHRIHIHIRAAKGFNPRGARLAGDDSEMAQALAEAYFDAVYPPSRA